MIVLEDIRSLSDFVRNAKAYQRRLQKTGRPEVLTVNGKASIVIQDAAAYQKLMDELEHARTQESLRQAERGEGLPVDEAFALIRKRARDRRKR
jgi:PHD/YefM family antitoxin component YafN of YafNO toxin-antitoxin module